MKKILLILIGLCIFTTFIGCGKDDGIKDPIILKLDGTWNISNNEGYIIFDVDDEQFEMYSNRGVIDCGEYYETLDGGVAFGYEDETGYIYKESTVLFTDSNSCYLNNLPFYGETKIYRE